MNYRNNFAQNFSLLRKSHRLSVKSLGDAIGVTNQMVSYLANGKRAPSFELLCSIAEYFHVSVDYLVGRTSFSLILDHESSNVLFSPEEQAMIQKQRGIID